MSKRKFSKEPEEDKISKEFFKYTRIKSGNNLPKINFTINSIEALRAYNEKVNFVPHFSEQLGFADWENSRYFVNGNETVLQVPVYNEFDYEVQALIIVAQTEDEFKSYVIRRGCFDDFIDTSMPKLTLDKVMDLFILADYQVFGNSSYFIDGKVTYGGDDSSRTTKGYEVEVTKCYYLKIYVAGQLEDSRWECETHYEYHSHFTTEGPDGSGGEGGSGNFSGFNGGSSPGGSPAPVPLPAPDTPVENPEDYLDCVDLNIGAKLTVYVDQPIFNSPMLVSPRGGVGHCFIGITQGDNVSILGFYPKESGKDGTNSPSTLGDNSNTDVDVSISINITPAQLKLIHMYILNSNNTNYDLKYYNCTDFVIEIAFLAGLTLPDTHNSYASNPALLGQEIRNMRIEENVSRNVLSSKSPANNKTCND